MPNQVWVLIFSYLNSRAVHLETQDSMDTSSFKLAFHRFQSLQGECTYLRSYAGSNIIGISNDDMMKDTSKDLENVVVEMRDHWKNLGKQWNIEPSLASHFGGLWERTIGQVRQNLQGYLLPRQSHLLSGDKFRTILLHASRIVNSTPLHEAPESPNDSQPITPHHLITQKGDACFGSFNRLSNYYEVDLLIYGANHLKRIEALHEELDAYWNQYIYQKGTNTKNGSNHKGTQKLEISSYLKRKVSPRLVWTGTQAPSYLLL